MSKKHQPDENILKEAALAFGLKSFPSLPGIPDEETNVEDYRKRARRAFKAGACYQAQISYERGREDGALASFLADKADPDVAEE